MKPKLLKIKEICDDIVSKGTDEIETHYKILDIIKSRQHNKIYKIYALSLDELYRPECHKSFGQIADISCDGNE